MGKFVAILSVFLIILSGCGGANSADTFVRVGATPESIDLSQISYSQSFDIAADVYSGIYEVNEKGELVLASGKEVKVSDDGLTYTVQLRDDEKWVNSNGEEMGKVTADDYLFEYERILTPSVAAPMSYLLTNSIVGADDMLAGKADFSKVGIKKINDYTISFTLKAKAPYFESMLAFPTFYPAPKGAHEAFGSDYGNAADKMWYNGAYYATDFNKDLEVKLVKNELYWGADKVQIPAITFRTLEDQTSMRSAFESGEVDYYATSDDETYKNGIGENKAHDRLTAFSFYMSLNMDSDRVTSDKNLREALYYGFDRASVNEASDGSISKPIEYFMPKGVTEVAYAGKEYRDYAKDSYVTFDLEKAKAALQTYMQSKGITNAKDVKVEFLINDATAGKRTGEAVQAQLEQDLGITVKTTILPANQYVEARNKGSFDIANGGWGADYADPSTYFEIFTTPNIDSINTPRFNNEQYNQIMKEAAQITDPAQRFAKYAEGEALILESEKAIIPFYQKNDPYFINEEYTMPSHLFLKISDKYTTKK